MLRYPKSFEKLIKNFASLPSVGNKMAERLVLHLFKQDEELLQSFSQNLQELTQLKQCRKCFHISEDELCLMCQDPSRDTSLLCIVEDPLDVLSIERTRAFTGLYHVLGGVLEVGRKKESQSDLTIAQLLTRLESEGVKEIIIAMNPTAEGDMTTLYLRKQLEKFPDIKISRPARGLSKGGDIEYADEETLGSALNHREKLGE